MCLIVMAHRVVPGTPVVVAANRDEQRARPSESIQLLETGPPRLAGGKDLSAGGTWMAIGEHGLVVGLTNQRGADGPAANRRSRGEIPLLLGSAPSAREAAQRASALDPTLYNPCTLFIADREEAFYAELVDTPRVRALRSGIHVLENRLLDQPSPKAHRVRERLGALEEREELKEHLISVVADPTIPEAPSSDRPAALNAARVDLGVSVFPQEDERRAAGAVV
ncbi:MAG: NRDE family protein, partial [Myxococcota bacterium]